MAEVSRQMMLFFGLVVVAVLFLLASFHRQKGELIEFNETFKLRVTACSNSLQLCKKDVSKCTELAANIKKLNTENTKKLTEQKEQTNAKVKEVEVVKAFAEHLKEKLKQTETSLLESANKVVNLTEDLKDKSEKLNNTEKLAMKLVTAIGGGTGKAKLSPQMVEVAEAVIIKMVGAIKALKLQVENLKAKAEQTNSLVPQAPKEVVQKFISIKLPAPAVTATKATKEVVRKALAPEKVAKEVVTEVPSAPEKATKEVVPEVPPAPEKVTKDVVPEVPSAPEKVAKKVVPEVPPAPEKAAKKVVPEMPPTPEKAAKEVVPQVPPAPEKAAKKVVPETPPAPEKATKEVVSEAPPAPEKAAKEVIPEAPPAPEKAAKGADSEVPPAPEKAAKEADSEAPPAPEKAAKEANSEAPPPPGKEVEKITPRVLSTPE